MTSDIIPETRNKDTSWPGLFPKIGQWYTGIIAAIVGSYWYLVVLLFGPQGKSEAKGNDGLYLAATILSVFLSLFLLIISFAGSFTAATNYATKNGIDPSVAIWIPVSVDGFIFLAVLVSFGASLVGAKAGAARLLIFSFTAISVVFNVAHILQPKQIEINQVEIRQAQPKKANVQHYLLGAIFPVVVFLASEVTSHQIAAYIRRKDALKTNQALADEIESLQQEKTLLPQEIGQARQAMLTEAQASVKVEITALDEQRETLQAEVYKAESRLKVLSQKTDNIYTTADLQGAHFLGKNPDATGNEIAIALGRTSATFGNSLKKKLNLILNGAMTNGNSNS